MRRFWRSWAAALGGIAMLAGAAVAQGQPVGLRQVEFADPQDPERVLALAVFYPAAVAGDAVRATLPFFEGLAFHRDAAPAEGGPFPLVLFSHGRGSNPMMYAWFHQLLASQGHVVAAPYHYRANSYDANIAYLANMLWRRPKDLSLIVDAMLADPLWGPLVDPGRIGVAGHSQGGFTALWIGGASVDAARYQRFQQGWRGNPAVPAHLRETLPLDAAPALDVADARIRAAFAMAPGVVQAFGMTAEGLARAAIPVRITVGAGDTQTPPGPNAAFAAEHIPGAELAILPGDVGHEIFVNLCDQEGRDEFPEACVDAPGVDRAAIHAEVGEAALQFFGRALAAR